MNLETQGPEVRRKRGEEGYNMVLLMVIVTTLTVLVAAALPSWSAFEQRESEEELIFRGLQYAEAIRVFQARFGRLPVRLEELIEVEPRSIRQLWVDPISGEQNWGLLFGDPSNPANCAPNPADQVDTGLSSGFDNGRNQTVTQGPICGVYSRASGDAIKTFMGANSYEEWHFTVGLLIGQGQGGPSDPPNPPDQQQNQQGQQGFNQALLQAGIAPNLSMRWIGRPWPEAVQEQLGQQQQPGGTNLGQGNLPGEGLDPSNQGSDPNSIFNNDGNDPNTNPSNRRGNRRNDG